MGLSEDDMGGPRPRVSVGMPVYNGAEFIGDAIQSILDQTFRDIELIICDNASNDATAEICRRFAASEKRVRYFPSPVNIGITANYNKVFSHARGEYFKWASSNDYCAVEMIERCVAVLDQRPDAVLCYPRTRLFDKELTDGKDYEDNLDLQEEDPALRFAHLIDRISLNNVLNGLVRADALRRTPLQHSYWGSDFNLVAELALHGKFVEIPERLFYRRINAKAHSSQQSEAARGHLWPNDKHALMFQTWRVHWEYFAAVSRAPLGYGAKWRLYLDLMKRMNRRKEELLWEFVSGLKQQLKQHLG